MFWHGLSLVSSRVKSMVVQRERNIGQFVFWVMTDITGAWTAAHVGNLIVSLLCCGFVAGVALMLHLCCVNLIFFVVGQLIVLLTIHYAYASSRSRTPRLPPQVPPALLPCCAGSVVSGETCSLPFVPLPLSFLYPGILSSVHSSFRRSIFFARNGSSL